MYACHVQMCHLNTGETPQGLPSLQLGPGWSLPWHWSFLLPPWPLLSYLICTSLSSPKAPCSTAFSKAIMVFSGPSCGREGHRALNLRVFSANIPSRVGKGPSNKRTLGNRVWLPWLFFQRSCLHFALPNLMWGLCSSDAMSLGTIKRKGLRIR